MEPECSVPNSQELSTCSYPAATNLLILFYFLFLSVGWQANLARSNFPGIIYAVTPETKIYNFLKFGTAAEKNSTERRRVKFRSNDGHTETGRNAAGK
jgi:hypothetical protein